ncbi:MAG: 2OG-Fe(II) oxygenase [Haliea sp.]
MKTTFETEAVLVIDEFLKKDEFALVWNEIQAEHFHFVHEREWVTAWRLDDGQPLRGPVYLSHRTDGDRISPAYPTGKAFDLIIRRIVDIEEHLVPWTGRRGADWSYFFVRPYIYPSGAGLSWHRDNKHNATAAFTFYAHPQWNVKWGGELLVADASTKDLEFSPSKLYSEEERILGSHFDNSVENDRLLSVGTGQYILPKANRLVIVATGIFHCIKKVDPAAGNHVRATVQGVFMYPRKPSEPS